jgi:hypothetical protein
MCTLLEQQITGTWKILQSSVRCTARRGRATPFFIQGLHGLQKKAFSQDLRLFIRSNWNLAQERFL